MNQRAVTTARRMHACTAVVDACMRCRISAQNLCLHCAAMPRRAYQDWGSWQNFGTQDWWAEVQGNPNFAGEIVLQRFCKGGLINPSEQTSADLAAGILLAEHGRNAALLPVAAIDRMFDWVKVHRNFRQHVLRSSCPGAVTTALGPTNRLQCVCKINFSVSFRSESSNLLRERTQRHPTSKPYQARRCNFSRNGLKLQGCGSRERPCLAQHHFHKSPSTQCARA